jgi:hypothetical protein
VTFLDHLIYASPAIVLGLVLIAVTEKKAEPGKWAASERNGHPVVGFAFFAIAPAVESPLQKEQFSPSEKRQGSEAGALKPG